MPETRIATPMVTANSCSSRPTIPPMNSTGMNTAASDSVMERMVKPISREPFSAASIGLFAHLHVADDVLQHDDGVVHHEADRERQRHQRQIVDAVVQQVHHRERADDRHRQRQAGNHRGRQHCAGTGRSPGSPGTSVSTSVNFTSLTESRIDCERSYRMSRLTEAGICALELAAAAALMPSTTSTVLVPGWRWMASTTGARRR